jgi:tripartite-type tricarboxylate transporter receptor subunit TctC
MALHRRRFLSLAGGAAAFPALSRSASAQAFPSRPITIIVPFPAGGSTSAMARILIEPLQTALGQTIVIENVGGAGGSIGVGRVARAAPDGYTISFSHMQTHVLNGAVLSLPYDVVKDFEPLALIADTPQAVITRKNFPADDLKGLIAWLKANPNKGTSGAVGVGGPSDISSYQFQKLTDTRLQAVPYRGGGPLLTDLISGQIDVNFGQVSTYIGAVRNGQLKILAMMSKERWWGAPEVPTVDEAGVPGLYGSYWHGMWAPKGTPKDVILKLNTALVGALSDAMVQQRFRDMGQSTWPREMQTPEALEAFQRAEIDKWWPIIRAAGIKGE